MESKYEPILGKWYGKDLKWPKNFTLIYKATRDGDFFENYWDKVEGIGNVFVFVRSEHGKTFGGYRSVPFKRPVNRYKKRKDKHAYIF